MDADGAHVSTPARSARAAILLDEDAVVQVSPHLYTVHGHKIKVPRARPTSCSCPDFVYRGPTPCKHMVAVDIYQGTSPAPARNE